MPDAAGSTETVRTHLNVLETVDTCPHCRSPLPNIKQHAVAALDLLNEARRQEPWTDTRWVCIRDNVPDPAPRGDAETCADYGHDFEYLEESNVTVCKHCGHRP